VHVQIPLGCCIYLLVKYRMETCWSRWSCCQKLLASDLVNSVEIVIPCGIQDCRKWHWQGSRDSGYNPYCHYESQIFESAWGVSRSCSNYFISLIFCHVSVILDWYNLIQLNFFKTFFCNLMWKQLFTTLLLLDVLRALCRIGEPCWARSARTANIKSAAARLAFTRKPVTLAECIWTASPAYQWTDRMRLCPAGWWHFCICTWKAVQSSIPASGWTHG